MISSLERLKYDRKNRIIVKQVITIGFIVRNKYCKKGNYNLLHITFVLKIIVIGKYRIKGSPKKLLTFSLHFLRTYGQYFILKVST